MFRLIASLVASLAVLSSADLAAAQQSEGKLPRIGYLGFYAEEGHKLLGEFRQGLKDLGYVEGKNIVIEVRNADGKRRRVPALVTELLSLNPDIIVAGKKSRSSSLGSDRLLRLEGPQESIQRVLRDLAPRGATKRPMSLRDSPSAINGHPGE